MSIDVINRDPVLLNKWLEIEKDSIQKYYGEHPDSLILQFENELKELGFTVQFPKQAISFLPKYKKTILPLCCKYYCLARDQKKENEQNFFLGFFHFKGFEEIIPMLLEDFYSMTSSDLTRWCIADALLSIRSKQYIKEYLDIVSQPNFGSSRKMIILLLGKLRAEEAVPFLINLLEDEDVRLQAICALGNYKRNEFRPYFERFQNDKHPGWRKYATNALKKLPLT